MQGIKPVRKGYLAVYSVLVGALLACSAAQAAGDPDSGRSASADSAKITASAADLPGSTASTAASAPASAEAPKAAPTLRLHAEVTDFVSAELSNNISDLNKLALDKLHRAELLAKEKHYKTPIAKLAASTRDLANLCTEYRGFEQSSEAADVILGEKNKLKSGNAVAYVKQKQSDDLQERIMISLMQMATGIGCTDSEQGKQAIREGMSDLEELTDHGQAQKALDTLQNWCQAQKVSFHPPLGGPMAIQAECHDVLGRALQQDTVVIDIKKSLHKYNGRSKLARTTAKVVNTTLSITSLSPTIVSPASQIAWLAFIMTQGGPEDSKLLKEVYLSKKFEHRYQTLSNETSLAVNSYNAALLSKNPALLAFSQFVIGQLCEPVQASAQAVSGADKAQAGSEKNASVKAEDRVSAKESTSRQEEKASEKDAGGASGEVAARDSSAGTLK